MKRALITGGAGFVGHHMVEHFLKNTDWEIVVLARLNTIGDINRIADIFDIEKYGDRLSFVYHDLKFDINPDVAELLGKFDYIAHLAANSHVDRSITHPKEFFMDNVIGTVNLLEWYRHYTPEARFINFSTDEVYGPAPDDYDFVEEDRYRPSNPYSAAKAGQSAAGHSYFVTYGLDIMNTYTMNIFGERQNIEKLVPRCIKNVYAGTPQPIHAELKDGLDSTFDKNDVIDVGKRHWLHARNAADAVLFLFNHGVKGEHYNIVGDTELANDEMANLIGEIMDREVKLEYVDFHRTRPGHDRRYALSGKKLADLGWVPPVSFKDSMTKMVKWTLGE